MRDVTSCYMDILDGSMLCAVTLQELPSRALMTIQFEVGMIRELGKREGGKGRRAEGK